MLKLNKKYYEEKINALLKDGDKIAFAGDHKTPDYFGTWNNGLLKIVRDKDDNKNIFFIENSPKISLN